MSYYMETGFPGIPWYTNYHQYRELRKRIILAFHHRFSKPIESPWIHIIHLQPAKSKRTAKCFLGHQKITTQNTNTKNNIIIIIAKVKHKHFLLWFKISPNIPSFLVICGVTNTCKSNSGRLLGDLEVKL